MNAVETINQQSKKKAIAPVRSGDTVRVHQLIREGSKQRVQVFEGVVIRTDRLGEVMASVTVRRIASGVGVEKSFLLHSPNISKIDITRRAKVRRNYLSYLRERRGKSARLVEQGFDKLAVNAVADNGSDKTELDVDQVGDAETQVEESTEELAKAERHEAAEADPEHDADSKDNEANLAAEETEAGVDRAGDSA
ncbi:MAG TPA: 50S ribosomal protein L19 [Candidatus Saccharimonadales bacterium]|nr:50S ribosomal protein L19 [Candidatus Saccharimonadales bacterium]